MRDISSSMIDHDCERAPPIVQESDFMIVRPFAAASFEVIESAQIRLMHRDRSVVCPFRLQAAQRRDHPTGRSCRRARQK